MVYRFIDKNKEQFGLRWLCRHFKISLNCYYNYLKDTKRDYYEQRFMVYERIKYIYYNNNRTIVLFGKLNAAFSVRLKRVFQST